MLTPASTSWRLVRTGVLAVVVLALAALAHRVAGGVLPHPLVLAALVAFTVAGTTAVARLRFTVPRLVVALGAGQLALHQALTTFATTGAACVRTASPVAGPGTGVHGGHVPAQATGGAVCAPGMHGLAPVPDVVTHLVHDGALGPGMVLAHGVATVLLALVVTHGDRAVERLVAWLVPSVGLPRGGSYVVPPARLPVPATVPGPRGHLLWCAVAPTRGPPPGLRPVTTT